MSIPKIIHQTGRQRDLSGPVKILQQKLLDLHPNWEYRFYSDSDCRDAVIQHHPEFLPIYDNYATNIQRVDLFRLIAVFAVGGFYLDLDVECLKPLDDLCRYNCVFGEELHLTDTEMKQLGLRIPIRVSNYMFGSIPGHPFLFRILKRIVRESRREINTEDDVLESTGPGLMSTVYHRYKNVYRDVVLLRNRDRACPVPQHKSISCHFGSYARHYHMGSWRWQDSGDEPKASSKPNELSESQIHRLKKRLLSIEKNIFLPAPIQILTTYSDKPNDGLSYVFHRVSKIGVPANDTAQLSNQKVLTCGIPTVYLDKLSANNTNFIYTTFESSKLPKEWVDAINNNYHYCIVPHGRVKEVFLKSGVNISIEIIHQGYSRYKRDRKPITKDPAFRIGFLGVPVRRKNLFKLYKACFKLLTKIPNLKLAVHVSHFYDWMDKSELAMIKSSPFVEWSQGTFSEDEMAGWYGRLSCLVVPSSGEGWSFPPRESLYLGIPTIISGIPVHEELAGSGYYPVIPSRAKEAAVFEGNIYGDWDRIKTNDIEESIWSLHQHYGQHKMQALAGGKWIEDKWTNYDSQQSLLRFINSIKP